MALTKESAARKDAATHSDFQHRHFATVARIIRNMNTGVIYNREDIANHFADALTYTNPRFDRRRFLAACGVAS